MKRHRRADDNATLIDASASGHVAVVDRLLREQGTFAADVRADGNAALTRALIHASVNAGYSRCYFL